jgi:hypothetical protein
MTGVTFSQSPRGYTFVVQGHSKQSRSWEWSSSRDSTLARRHSWTLLHLVHSILKGNHCNDRQGPFGSGLRMRTWRKGASSLRQIGQLHKLVHSCPLSQSSFRTTWIWQVSYNVQTCSKLLKIERLKKGALFTHAHFIVELLIWVACDRTTWIWQALYNAKTWSQLLKIERLEKGALFTHAHFTIELSIWVAWKRATWIWQASYNAQTNLNYWRLRALRKELCSLMPTLQSSFQFE